MEMWDSAHVQDPVRGDKVLNKDIYLLLYRHPVSRKDVHRLEPNRGPCHMLRRELKYEPFFVSDGET